MLVELARAIVALGRGRVRLNSPWKGRVEVTRSEWQRLEALAAAGLQEAKVNP